MEPNQFIYKERCAAQCGASGKRRNAGDGLIWPTEGRFFGPPDGVVLHLWSAKTTARSTPCQQTRKSGQMILPTQKVLY